MHPLLFNVIYVWMGGKIKYKCVEKVTKECTRISLTHTELKENLNTKEHKTMVYSYCKAKPKP